MATTQRRPTPGDRGRSGRPRSRARDVVLGSERRLGLWILPLFLLTALLGATLAGSLVVLYYAQQVAELRETTATARAQLDEAVEEVEAAVEAATEEIDDQVRRVRESLAQGLPVESPHELGIYALSASHDGGEVRVGSTFTVFSDDSETFLVTSFALVDRGDDRAVRTVEVFLPNQTVQGRVHNYDPDLDLAVVVLGGGPLPVAEWRPADMQVRVGDPIYLAGVGGPGTATVVEGRVGGVSQRAVIPTVGINTFTAGGPLIDTEAQVVAIAALRYSPFGPTEGDLRYAVPIRRICEELLRCTRADLGVDDLGDEGGIGVPEPEPDDAEPDDDVEPDDDADPDAEPGDEAEPEPSPQPSPTPTG